jgi:cytochrome c biogenesis protein
LSGSSQTNQQFTASAARIVHFIWRFLASLKLAILLMLILVGLSLIGTFLVQVPSEYTQNAQSYQWWLEEVAQNQSGAWYPILKLLGFFNLFQSVWFIAAGVLLVLNIIVCSIKRWKQVQARISPKLNPRIVKESATIQKWLGISSLEPLAKYLKTRGYRTSLQETGQEKYLTAHKNRFSLLGTYLVHISLILIILGFIIGRTGGFENRSFIINEGETRAVGYNTGLGLKLNSFQIDYYPDGSPQDYQSRIDLLDNGKEVKNATIQVNHPLRYHGVRFYQSYYGQSVILQIELNGQSLFKGPVALDRTMNNHPYIRPAGKLELAEAGYMIYIVSPATNLADLSLQKDQIGIEVYRNNNQPPITATVISRSQPLNSGDLKIIYSGTGYFSGFLINSDPGVGLIWTAAALLLLGLIMVFYYPRCHLNAVWQKAEDQGVLQVLWDHSPASALEARHLKQFLITTYRARETSNSEQEHQK